MAESDLHWEVTSYCISALRAWFASRPDVYVAGDNFIYYEQGQPKSFVSPDCYVVFDVEMRLRDSYKAWENSGHLPDVVIEITSKSTRSEDTGKKYLMYQNVLQVSEYFLFDPTADYITTRLRGYRLGRTGYAPIEPDAQGHLHSEQIGLDLVVEGNRLRFFDPIGGFTFQTYAEIFNRAQEEAHRADTEARRAQEEKQRADAEALRANEQAKRADAEAQAAVTLQAELALIRATLEALQKSTQETTLLRSTGNTPQDEQE